MDGRVTSGSGRAAGFVASISDLVVTELGFAPYPGTLNLTDCQLPSTFPSRTLRDIEEVGDVCEGVQFVECDLGGVRSAVVRPLIEGYPEGTVELLAPVELRAVLGLVDGDTVRLTRPDDRWPSTGPRVDVEGLDAYDAVVFDLDGTLVDLDIDWTAVKTDLRGLLGPFVQGDLFEQEYDLGTVARENDVYDAYLDLLATVEAAGARRARGKASLALLSVLSVPVGVCTRNAVEAARIALDRFGVADAVDVVVGRETLFSQKPHPAPLERCVSTLDARPGNAVFVGDDRTDCTTATAAGTSFFTPDRLAAASD
ncbi:HAD-IA family hydrolase [Salinigranum sp. GCM10025319]|uniref:HAD-IA family hydrolase n=1 Tax=Salinigranum sp. GCM10025319 TaxID=3252687 RepID=UPI00361EF5C0